MPAEIKIVTYEMMILNENRPLMAPGEVYLYDRDSEPGTVKTLRWALCRHVKGNDGILIGQINLKHYALKFARLLAKEEKS